MNRALWKLLHLRARAAMRSRFVRLRTARGCLSLLVITVVLALVFSSRAWTGESLPEVPELQFVTRLAFGEDVLTLLLLAGCILTLVVESAPPIYFSPAETQFLLAGPFSRRDLLLYKFAAYGAGAGITAMLAALLAWHRLGFLASFVTILLAVVFVQLLTTLIALLDLETRIRGVRYVRGLALALMTAALVALIGQRSESAWAALLLRDTQQLLWFATAPVRVFAHLFYVRSFLPEFLLFAAAGAAMNVGLLLWIVWLNADYRETVTTASQRRYARWYRAKQSGVWTDLYSSRRQLPRLFGRSPFGMLVWRQLVSAIRTFRGTLVKLLLLAIVLGPFLAVPQIMPASLKTGIIASLVLFLLPKAIVFDFRGDWENMEHLRSLPLRPWVVCAAQLVTPVILTTSLELVCIASALPFVPLGTAARLLLLATYLVPFNALLYAADNLVFLLFPAPQIPVGRLDFEFFGRALVEVLVRTFLLAFACALALRVGLLASSWGWIGFVGTSWAVLAMCSVMLLPWLAWAYQRFGVAQE